MIIDYPSVLPCFQRAGYSYQHFDTHQRTEFNSGYVRQRRKANGHVKFNVTLKLTDDELEIFEAWREHDLADIGWFNAPLKTGGKVEDWVVQFVSKGFEHSNPLGGKWQLGFQLLARKPKFIDQLALYTKAYGVDENTGSDFMSIIDNYYTRD